MDKKNVRSLAFLTIVITIVAMAVSIFVLALQNGKTSATKDYTVVRSQAVVATAQNSQQKQVISKLTEVICHKTDSNVCAEASAIAEQPAVTVDASGSQAPVVTSIVVRPPLIVQNTVSVPTTRTETSTAVTEVPVTLTRISFPSGTPTFVTTTVTMTEDGTTVVVPTTQVQTVPTTVPTTQIVPTTVPTTATDTQTNTETETATETAVVTVTEKSTDTTTERVTETAPAQTVTVTETKDASRPPTTETETSTETVTDTSTMTDTSTQTSTETVTTGFPPIISIP